METRMMTEDILIIIMNTNRTQLQRVFVTLFPSSQIPYTQTKAWINNWLKVAARVRLSNKPKKLTTARIKWKIQLSNNNYTNINKSRNINNINNNSNSNNSNSNNINTHNNSKNKINNNNNHTNNQNSNNNNNILVFKKKRRCKRLYQIIWRMFNPK